MSIVKRTWALGALAVAVVAAGGCQEPEQIITGVPPGSNYRASIEIKETPSEAIGEMGGTVKSQDAAKTKAAHNHADADTPPALPTAKGEEKTTPGGVKYKTVKEGTGPTVKAGQRVKVHYVGTLEDGRKFDSSRDRGRPDTFSIGTHAAIKGWDEAVPGMKVGEVRELEVPPSAGYGALGQGGKVPPNATLRFEVEVVGIE